MNVVLVPQRREENLSLVKQGDVLWVNGEAFDFSAVAEGDILPGEAIDSMWFTGPVKRIDGSLTVSIFLPNPWNYSQAQAFPEPITVDKDGPIILPKPLPEFKPSPPITHEALEK